MMIRPSSCNWRELGDSQANNNKKKKKKGGGKMNTEQKINFFSWLKIFDTVYMILGLGKITRETI